MIIVLILMILPLFSAAQFNFRDSYNKGETLIGKISGSFIDPIGENDITFYKGHTRIPVEYKLYRYSNNEYYLYALLGGKDAGGYSFTISNVRYFIEGAQVADDDLTFNFTINDVFADFSVNPGFIESGGDFDIEITNLLGDSLTINGSENNELFALSDATTLNAGETKDLTVDITTLGDSNLQLLKLSAGATTYEIPIFVTGIEEELVRSFKFQENVVVLGVKTNESFQRVVHLFNDGDYDLASILFFESGRLSNYVNISPEEIPLIKSGEMFDVVLNITGGDKEETINGEIRAVAYDPTISTILPIQVIVSNEPQNKTVEVNGTVTYLTQTCEELNGSVCTIDEETCSEDNVNTKSGACCLGICQEIKKSSKGKIIGWLIVIFAVLYVLWFFINRFRKTGKRVANIMDVFKKS